MVGETQHGEEGSPILNGLQYLLGFGMSNKAICLIKCKKHNHPASQGPLGLWFGGVRPLVVPTALVFQGTLPFPRAVYRHSRLKHWRKQNEAQWNETDSKETLASGFYFCNWNYKSGYMSFLRLKSLCINFNGKIKPQTFHVYKSFYGIPRMAKPLCRTTVPTPRTLE